MDWTSYNDSDNDNDKFTDNWTNAGVKTTRRQRYEQFKRQL